VGQLIFGYSVATHRDRQKKRPSLPCPSFAESIPISVCVPCVSPRTPTPCLIRATSVDLTHIDIRFGPLPIMGTRMGNCWRLYLHIRSNVLDDFHLLGKGAYIGILFSAHEEW